VKRRRIDSALVAWTSCAIAVCGVNSIDSAPLLPRFSRCLRRPFGGLGRTLDHPLCGGRNGVRKPDEKSSP
jgi:hypothetical protein